MVINRIGATMGSFCTNTDAAMVLSIVPMNPTSTSAIRFLQNVVKRSKWTTHTQKGRFGFYFLFNYFFKLTYTYYFLLFNTEYPRWRLCHAISRMNSSLSLSTIAAIIENIMLHSISGDSSSVVIKILIFYKYFTDQ